MEKTVLHVEGMSCQHCVKAVTGAVEGLSGVSGVRVSLENKSVEVDYDPAQCSLDKIKDAIEDQGYDVMA